MMEQLVVHPEVEVIESVVLACLVDLRFIYDDSPESHFWSEEHIDQFGVHFSSGLIDIRPFELSCEGVFCFDVFDRFFTSQQEQQEFYRHIVHSYVYALSDLTGEALLWEIVDDDEKGDFPRITGEYTKFIQTKKNQSHKETALWISSLYKQKQQKPVQKNLQQ